jgi:hypothetical protein
VSASRIFVVLAAASLPGCVPLPPRPPPPLVATPGLGKTQAQFSQDDIACRVAVVDMPAAGAETSKPAPPPDAPPGVAYLRCMENRDNIIQPMRVVWPRPRPNYPVGDYGGDYYPWVYSDSVSFGSSR